MYGCIKDCEGEEIAGQRQHAVLRLCEGSAVNRVVGRRSSTHCYRRGKTEQPEHRHGREEREARSDDDDLSRLKL